MKDAFGLTVDGGPALRVHSFETVERWHLTSRARVVVRPADPAVGLDAEELLGARATLDLGVSAADTREPRLFHGVVDAVEVEVGGAALTLVPRIVPLGDGCDHRVFLDRDAVAIAEILLGEASLPFESRVASPPPVRRQCVQAFESKLAFLRRILAEDGIALWVEHREGEDVVVIGGDDSACDDLPGGALLRVVEGGALVEGEAILELQVARTLTHDGAAVTDYDPEHPAVDLGASVGGPRYARFVYPGRHASVADGEVRARTLLEEARTEQLVVRGRTNCRHLAVGFVIEIADAPLAEQNGRFRILEVRQRGRDAVAGVEGGATPRGEGPGDAGDAMVRHVAEFVAVPADGKARPRRERARGLGGLQTMDVTGPGGEEIHTDDQGRIKARFRWDRLSPTDDGSSTWIRPAQPPLSGGFFLPRMGWEVLVGFLAEPTPVGDTPIELGRLIHGQAPPAESLPGHKVRSNWGTLTTPGGGKVNQLRLDDAAGAEDMLIGAAKDLNERTENDKVTLIKADEAHTVGGNHVTSVTLQQIDAIGGAQSYTVGGNRTVTTTGIFGIAAASETVVVGGVREFTVGGDYETKAATLARVVGAAENVTAIQEANRHVTGASTIGIGGTWAEVGGLHAAVGVLGASTLTVGGPMSIGAANVSINATTLSESYGGLFKSHAGGKFTLEAPVVKLQAGAAFEGKGADVFFKATSRITVKAGGVTITITPGSIKVKGKVKGAKSVVTTKEEVK